MLFYYTCDSLLVYWDSLHFYLKIHDEPCLIFLALFCRFMLLATGGQYWMFNPSGPSGRCCQFIKHFVFHCTVLLILFVCLFFNSFPSYRRFSLSLILFWNYAKFRIRFGSVQLKLFGMVL